MPLMVFKNGRVDTIGCIKSKECFMPDNRNRKRPIQVKFFVDERELGLIKARMAQLGIENMSAYLRKMAIDGYEEKPDLPELRESKNP